MLLAAVAEHDVEAHARSVESALPSLARVGADDRTVAPFFVARVWRLLREAGARAAARAAAARASAGRGVPRLPSKEHWWWTRSARTTAA